MAVMYLVRSLLRQKVIGRRAICVAKFSLQPNSISRDRQDILHYIANAMNIIIRQCGMHEKH